MERFTLQSAPQYERHYDNDGFWKKLRRVAAQAGAKVIYPALQLYFVLQSKEVPLKVKTLIVGALGYLILPADLVPDFIPLLGFTDDLSALLLVLRAVNEHLTPEINRQANERAEKLLKA